MIDRAKIAQDAKDVIEYQPGTVAADVAAHLVSALADPSYLIPDGYALVKKPELLGLGVPAR